MELKVTINTGNEIIYTTTGEIALVAISSTREIVKPVVAHRFTVTVHLCCGTNASFEVDSETDAEAALSRERVVELVDFIIRAKCGQLLHSDLLISGLDHVELG